MSSDRKTLIRLASSLPKGSGERRTLLASLQKVALTVDASNEEAGVDGKIPHHNPRKGALAGNDDSRDSREK